jgi:deazaflavin-dependent oxidoreductase (nitroreductase family)
MSISATPRRPRAATRARLFGLRQPGRLALAVFRMPLFLYRHGRGHLLGHTFLIVEHVGRRTGRTYAITAMVLSYDEATGEAIIFSGWGSDADWVRNLKAHPAVRVQIGRTSFVPEQRFLTDDEAMKVADAFRRRHPWRVRLASTLLGWGDLRADSALREFVRVRPFVAFWPKIEARTTEASGAQ